MVGIIKKSKFLKYSISCTLYILAILEAIFSVHFFYDIPSDIAQFLWLFEVIFVGMMTFAAYMLFILFYPKIYQFILEKDYLRDAEVKKVIKKINYFYGLLLTIVCVCYIIYAKHQILNCTIVTVMMLSLWVGFATLVTIFVYAKHGLPYKRESVVNLSAFVIFIGCVKLCSYLQIDKTVANPEFLSMALVLIMMIFVNNKVIKERFFEGEKPYLKPTRIMVGSFLIEILDFFVKIIKYYTTIK